MKFSEKLAHLTAERNKTQLSKEAGLRDSAVSELIAKNAVPRSDTALALARALNVPLDWLVDDEAGFPAPTPGATRSDVRDFHDHDLLLELGRRWALDLQYLSTLHQDIRNRDLRAVAQRAFALPLDQRDAQVEELLSSYKLFHAMLIQAQFGRDLESVAGQQLDDQLAKKQARGEDFDDALYDWRTWLERIGEWDRQDPGCRALNELEVLRARHGHPELGKDVEQRRLERLAELEGGGTLKITPQQASPRAAAKNFDPHRHTDKFKTPDEE